LSNYNQVLKIEKFKVLSFSISSNCKIWKIWQSNSLSIFKSFKYRPLLYADFLSAILRICKQNYCISEERILQFTNVIGLITCEFVIFEPIFWVPTPYLSHITRAACISNFDRVLSDAYGRPLSQSERSAKVSEWIKKQILIGQLNFKK